MAAFLLSGSLEEISLPDVARLINATQKTGLVAVVSGMDTGSIYFDRGDIVDALASSFAGLDAIKHVALFSKGNFEFVDGATAPNQNLTNYPTSDIIRVLENRTNEARQLQELMPTSGDYPKYLGGAIPAGFEVSAAELAVALRASNGTQTTQQLATELNLDILMVRYTVARFRAAGLMEIAEGGFSVEPLAEVQPPDAIPTVPVPGGHVDSTSTAPKYWRGRRIG